MKQIPTLMTIPEVAATGLLSEYALRKLNKEGRLPSFRVGNRVLINYEKHCPGFNLKLLTLC